MKENNYRLCSFLILLLFFVTACNDNNKQAEQKTTGAPDKETTKNITKVIEPPAETKRGPVINITDTLSIKQLVLTMKDSAATMERIGLKLGEIYGVKLAAIMKKNNLKNMGAPVAWYKTSKAPYFFEAGLPVNKKPSKLSGGAYIKEIGIDSIVVAHFYGPYELLPQGYDALRDWIKSHKKKINGVPYEIYVDDPVDSTGKPKDPYKVRTDIIFAWK